MHGYLELAVVSMSTVPTAYISPDTSDIQFVWMVFPSGFINHNLDYTISYSYGSALRARKIPMALGMSILLAASSSTTTTVPTAAYSRRTRGRTIMRV